MSKSPLPPNDPQWPSAAPPLALDYAMPSERPVDLRAIAIRQRAVIGCILFYLVMAVGGLLLVPVAGSFVWVAEAALASAVVVAGSVLGVVLALSVYSDPATGIIGGMLIFVPVIGLFILLVINHDATKVLRRHGVRVGLLGASLRQLPPSGRNAGR